MSAAFHNFFERHGIKMDWRCRPSFLAWFFVPVVGLALLVLALLSLNPQSSRFVYIFQSMFVSRDDSHPWGDNGPRPPPHYSGVWYRWHWNGRLSFEEHYIDGKLDGPFRAWDRLGHQWLETAYRAGLYHGDYVLFYENGATNRLNHYFEEKATGQWVHFYRDGTKWEERFFSAPGVPDGEERVWNTNDTVTFTRTWHQGEPWNGRFTLHKGSNWFHEEYELGRLVSTTNVGPIPPWAYVRVRAPAEAGKK